jgi:hypothetical protein
MSYYNNIIVVFTVGEDLNWRTGGQMLPAGAVPLAVVNFCQKKYFEVINTFTPEEILDFLNESVDGGSFEGCVVNDFILS